MRREVDFAIIRPFGDWLDYLSPARACALEDMCPNAKCWTPFTAGEVLDLLVEWYGGLATGSQVTLILSDIFGWC